MLNVKTKFINDQLKDSSVYSLVQLRDQVKDLILGSRPSSVEFVVIGSPAKVRKGQGLIIPAAWMTDSELLMACLINASHSQFNGNKSSDRYSLEELTALKSPTRRPADEAYNEAYRRSMKTTGYCDTQILWVNLTHQDWNNFRHAHGGVNLTSAETRKLGVEVLDYVAQRLQ